MKTRTQLLLDIRPEVQTAGTAQSAEEQLQNQVIRPILKLQNELLVAVFQEYTQKRKQPWGKQSPQAQADFIQHTLTKDQRLRQLMLGLVVAHFSVHEYAQYLAHESEYNKRIITMMIQRLTDQLVAWPYTGD